MDHPTDDVISLIPKEAAPSSLPHFERSREIRNKAEGAGHSGKVTASLRNYAAPRST